MKANISLDLHLPEIARRVLLTIDPDNKPLPAGLEIDCSLKGSWLSISIHCTRGINSFTTTLEDILSAIDLSLRTSETVDSTN